MSFACLESAASTAIFQDEGASFAAAPLLLPVAVFAAGLELDFFVVAVDERLRTAFFFVGVNASTPLV
jgi:hypothetical protein